MLKGRKARRQLAVQLLYPQHTLGMTMNPSISNDPNNRFIHSFINHSTNIYYVPVMSPALHQAPGIQRHSLCLQAHYSIMDRHINKCRKVLALKVWPVDQQHWYHLGAC